MCGGLFLISASTVTSLHIHPLYQYFLHAPMERSRSKEHRWWSRGRERGSGGAERKDSIARGGSDRSRGPIKRRGIYRARARDESRVRSRCRGHLKRSFRESLLGEKSACARAALIDTGCQNEPSVRHRSGSRRAGPMRRRRRWERFRSCRRIVWRNKIVSFSIIIRERTLSKTWRQFQKLENFPSPKKKQTLEVQEF